MVSLTSSYCLLDGCYDACSDMKCCKKDPDKIRRSTSQSPCVDRTEVNMMCAAPEKTPLYTPRVSIPQQQLPAPPYDEYPDQNYHELKEPGMGEEHEEIPEPSEVSYCDESALLPGRYDESRSAVQRRPAEPAEDTPSACRQTAPCHSEELLSSPSITRPGIPSPIMRSAKQAFASGDSPDEDQPWLRLAASMTKIHERTLKQMQEKKDFLFSTTADVSAEPEVTDNSRKRMSWGGWQTPDVELPLSDGNTTLPHPRRS